MGYRKLDIGWATRITGIDPMTKLILPRTIFFLFLACVSRSAAGENLEVGFASADITPTLESETKVYLAGLELNRVAKEVNDRLFSRAMVLESGGHKIALVSVDLIGLQYPSVLKVRASLADFDYVAVMSTHTHAAPDVVGIWGSSRSESGIDTRYVQQVEDQVVRSVRAAEEATVRAVAEYAALNDESMLGDFRLPHVLDSTIRLLRFRRASDKSICGIFVQWNAHGIEPRDNSRITRDFFGVTVDELARRHDCEVVYVTGANGGLMGTPDGMLRKLLADKDDADPFDAIELYGKLVADMADRALAEATPIELAPLEVSAKKILIPMDNPGFTALRRAGVLSREAYRWTGDRDPKDARQAGGDGPEALATEVAYLRLGELHIATIPGEIYPEIIYGEYPSTPEEGVDFPEASLERTIDAILPGVKKMFLGLANDEIGYILPKRQWDVTEPFAYGRTSAQYGEVNSMGPETARHLTETLAECVEAIQP
ncbi:MAG: hypothetical protein GXP29_03800 [Planctomycetes bacterium]|nr:hypothetical protein [Planctomycetota bacterium]